jgi:hypothetical protein
MKAGGIALAILGDVNNSLCDQFTRCDSCSEAMERFAGVIEGLAHSQGSGVVEPNILDRNAIHRDLPKKYEREHRRVSQSPRLEAVSVMPEPWSFDWGLSGQNRTPVNGGLTCRIDRSPFLRLTC